MKLHAKAALTPKQRQAVKDLYATGKCSHQELAERFGTTRKTIAKWLRRPDTADASNAPKHHGRRTITPEFEQAVKKYRQDEATSHHGKIRIAHELRSRFACSNPSNVYLALKNLGLNTPQQSAPKPENHLPVGKHRTQMDIQYLPAVEGGTGYSYKISIIHLSTRYKYSEIHDNCTSKTIAKVYRRAMDNLPPFLSPSPITPWFSPWNTPLILNGKPPSRKLSKQVGVSMRSFPKQNHGKTALSNARTEPIRKIYFPKYDSSTKKTEGTSLNFGKWNIITEDHIKVLATKLPVQSFRNNIQFGRIFEDSLINQYT